MKKQKTTRLITDHTSLRLLSELDQNKITNLIELIGNRNFTYCPGKRQKAWFISFPKTYARLVRRRLANWKIEWANN